ncbi:hypothetical protein [Nonlabens sp.]|uniref:hypothetical protein n=1 Tax=Nonlabens sp. TaxID=1888209 RepID=UPI003F6998DB
MIDILVFLFVIFFGNMVQNSFSKGLSAWHKKNLQRLWLFHLLFGCIYWLYIVYGPGGDSLGYYKVSESLSLQEATSLFLTNGSGTFGMYLLNVLPSKLMGFFGLTMIYTLIGYIGLGCFYRVFINNVTHNSTLGAYQLFPLVFFLPNLHFWSAGLSKDTLLFFCIGVFVYSMQQPSRHLFKIALVLVLSYLVRPHITMFLIISFGTGFVLDGNLKLFQKIIFGTMFLIAFALLFDKIMAYLKIEDLDASTINDFAGTRATNLSRSGTGSSVDISSYPYPLKIFTFLFRPLFFDINGVLAIVASFENLILLILSWKMFKLNPIKIFAAGNYIVKSLFIFLIVGTLSFSLILGNLGIMLRQKNMFIPALLFICLWAFSYQQQKHEIKKVTH